jgi:hypothetical protein
MYCTHVAALPLRDCLPSKNCWNYFKLFFSLKKMMDGKKLNISHDQFSFST